MAMGVPKPKTMDSDKELINRIRSFKEIKPDTDWAAFTKARIIGHEAVGQRRSIMSVLGEMILGYRVALAGLLVFLVAGGTVVVAQNALPGEPLYALKRVTEKGVALVTGKDKIAAANLELAAKRLEEINLVSEKNLVQNLPAAFEEYKSAKAAAKSKVAAQIQQNPENASQIVKEAAVAMKGMNDLEKQVYGALGLEQNASTTIDVAEAASDQAIVASLIDYLKDSPNLSEEQTKELEQVRGLYDAANYSQALDKYLGSTLNK